MKSILVIFVYGVACCLAKPKCGDDELKKCITLYPPFKVKENETSPTMDINEEFMDKYCDYHLCMMDFFDRCGVPGPGMLMGTVAAFEQFPEPLHGSTDNLKKIYDKLCIKTSPLRKKFIAHGNCIYKASMEAATNGCVKDIPNFEDKAERCRLLFESRKCIQGVITRRCGQEASELADELTPKVEDNGCSE